MTSLSWRYKMRKYLFVFLLLTGCFRPNYVSQPVNLPCSWRIPTDEGSTLCNVKWWEQFNDPVLNELILTALRNNQDLNVAIARVFEYYARLGIVNSAMFPAVTGNASYNRIQGSIAAGGALPGSPRINNDYKASLNLNWELDVWGKLYSATEEAYATLLSQIETRRAIVVTVVRSVAGAYIRLREFDLQLEISKKTLESRLYSLKLAEDRFKEGETSEIEVKQAESEVEIAAISVLEFEREIPKQENLLSILLGEFPHDITRGLSIEELQYPVDIPAGLPCDLLFRRPDILAAEDVLVAANAQVAVARALFFPQFNLTGAYGSESTSLKNFLTSPAEFWQYGMSMVQTIFDAGRIGYQVASAKALRDQALFSYRQTILQALREVDDALVSYTKDRQLVSEHRKQVKVLGDYLHLAQLRYDEGEIDYLNVLDAERSLFNAQLDLVQAQGDSFVAVVDLYSALGGGWVVDADCTMFELKSPNKY